MLSAEFVQENIRNYNIIKNAVRRMYLAWWFNKQFWIESRLRRKCTRRRTLWIKKESLVLKNHIGTDCSTMYSISNVQDWMDEVVPELISPWLCAIQLYSPTVLFLSLYTTDHWSYLLSHLLWGENIPFKSLYTYNEYEKYTI